MTGKADAAYSPGSLDPPDRTGQVGSGAPSHTR